MGVPYRLRLTPKRRLCPHEWSYMPNVVLRKPLRVRGPVRLQHFLLLQKMEYLAIENAGVAFKYKLVSERAPR